MHKTVNHSFLQESSHRHAEEVFDQESDDDDEPRDRDYCNVFDFLSSL